jgi:hypothetical protein
MHLTKDIDSLIITVAILPFLKRIVSKYGSKALILHRQFNQAE